MYRWRSRHRHLPRRQNRYRNRCQHCIRYNVNWSPRVLTDSRSMSMRPRTVTILWILTVAFCVSLVFDLVPLLRGDMPWYDATYDWAWNSGPPRWSSLIPCILGVAIYVLGAAQLLTTEHDSRYPVRLILWAFIGAALIPLLLMTLEGQPLFLLFTRTASRLTGGYLDASTLITDLNTTLRRWPQFM